MDENIFGMSIKDINTDKSINLAKEYHFSTIDDDISDFEKRKTSNVVKSDDKIE